MKEFEPSQDFVLKVMQSVRACEAETTDQTMIVDRLLSSRLVRICPLADLARILGNVKRQLALGRGDFRLRDKNFALSRFARMDGCISIPA